MNMQQFLRTWNGTQSENRFSRWVIAGLLILLLVLMMLLFKKDQTLVLQPWSQSSEEWVSTSNSSAGYKEAWGFALAQLLGNVTPATVEFVRERIDELLAPSIYNDVMKILEVQSKQIQKDRISMEFTPRFVEYEPTTKRVFVYGRTTERAMTGSKDSAPRKTERTYEFEIGISNYLPVVRYIDVYSGRPKTEKVLKRMERMEQKDAERNSRHGGVS